MRQTLEARQELASRVSLGQGDEDPFPGKYGRHQSWRGGPGTGHSLITTTHGTEEYAEAGCRRAAFYILRPVWRSKCRSLWIKLRIFNSNIKSVLLCVSEIRGLTERIVAKIQVFVNCRLRYILGVQWPCKISNEDRWQCTNQERVEVSITMKWRWIGRDLRKPANTITRQSLEWNPQEG